MCKIGLKNKEKINSLRATYERADIEYGIHSSIVQRNIKCQRQSSLLILPRFRISSTNDLLHLHQWSISPTAHDLLYPWSTSSIAMLHLSITCDSTPSPINPSLLMVPAMPTHDLLLSANDPPTSLMMIHLLHYPWSISPYVQGHLPLYPWSLSPSTHYPSPHFWSVTLCTHYPSPHFWSVTLCTHDLSPPMSKAISPFILDLYHHLPIIHLHTFDPSPSVPMIHLPPFIPDPYYFLNKDTSSHLYPDHPLFRIHSPSNVDPSPI